MWDYRTLWGQHPSEVDGEIRALAEEGYEVAHIAADNHPHLDEGGLWVIMRRLKQLSMHRYDTRIPVAEVAQEEAPIG